MSKNPEITIHDCLTGETVTRPMTDEEFEVMVSAGWTEEPQSVEIEL